MYFKNLFIKALGTFLTLFSIFVKKSLLKRKKNARNIGMSEVNMLSILNLYISFSLPFPLRKHDSKTFIELSTSFYRCCSTASKQQQL